MKVISILNHKGGVGKSTISTNLAGYYANNGGKVLIGDFDMQNSSQNWLSLRPTNAMPIYSWEIRDGKISEPPKDTTHIIIDSPAGIEGVSLENLLSLSDKVIVPVRPGAFDMMSTQSFLKEAVEIINKQDRGTDICVVGNMVDMRTKAADNLAKFVSNLGLACPLFIQTSQVYVYLAEKGLTIFDSKEDIFASETERWKSLVDWIASE